MKEKKIKIDIIEEHPIRSLDDFTDITAVTDDSNTLDLIQYFESKEAANTLSNITFTIRYLNHETNDIIHVRSNKANNESPAKIESNQLIIMPD